MTDILEVHPTHPQQRLINRAVTVLQSGGVIVYPTDSGYALGCHMGDKSALDRLRKIRELDPRHHFTLMCRDLSEIALYARVSNSIFRLLKAHTPGEYTFILEATKEVPKRVQQQKRKTIGIRVPKNEIALDLLAHLGEPMLSTSLILPNEDFPLSDAQDIYDHLRGRVEIILDGGPISQNPTSVIDLSSGTPEVLRKGAGDITAFS